VAAPIGRRLADGVHAATAFVYIVALPLCGKFITRGAVGILVVASTIAAGLRGKTSQRASRQGSNGSRQWPVRPSDTP